MTLNLDNRTPMINTQYLHLTAALLCTIGRWWCDLPANELQKLQELSFGMRPETGLNCMTEGNRRMLRQFDDRDLARRVLFLPDTVYSKFADRQGFSQGELVGLQRAAMVAIQLATALRPKNLAGLQLGKNLLERGGKLHVHVPAAEVKNKVELEFILPDHAAKIIRFYVAKVRPLLLNGSNDYLWPGEKGHKSPAYVGKLLGDFMQTEIGVRVTGHRFRHLVGYIYLLDNPNGYEVVRLLLGHRSIKTTMTYYASLEAKEGYKRFDAFVTHRRSEGDLERDDVVGCEDDHDA